VIRHVVRKNQKERKDRRGTEDLGRGRGEGGDYEKNEEDRYIKTFSQENQSERKKASPCGEKEGKIPSGGNLGNERRGPQKKGVRGKEKKGHYKVRIRDRKVKNQIREKRGHSHLR